MNPNSTRFTELILRANDLGSQDLKNWAFYPGMLFNSPDKWWGDFGRRDFPHEGIDLCLYHDPGGELQRLDQRTRIPVIHSGVVRAMFKDYLGQAVIVEHENLPGQPKRVLSVYAHTRPMEKIEPGVRVEQGEVIATIADTSRSKAKILPHLHLSFGRPSPEIVYDAFVWNIMRDPDLVTLLDPINVIEWPWQVLDPGSEFSSAT